MSDPDQREIEAVERELPPYLYSGLRYSKAKTARNALAEKIISALDRVRAEKKEV